MRSFLPLVAAFAALLSRSAHAGDVSDPVVHIDSPRSVVLERDDGAVWTEVCASPCDRVVPRYATYRINGAGVHASAPFRLAPESGARVELHVSPAGTEREVGGALLIVSSIGLAAGGFLELVAGLGEGLSASVGADCGASFNTPQQRAACDRNVANNGAGSAEWHASIALFVAAGAALVTGIALVASGGDTKAAGDVSAAPSRDARVVDVRGPGWSPPPPKLGASLLTIRF